MKKSIIFGVLLISVLPAAYADSEKEYSICKVAGYYEGNGNRFLYELAMRVVEKNRLNTHSECSEAMKIGKDVAIKFSKPGKVRNEEDSQVMEKAEHFSELVYDAILSRIKFD